jgi:hypothetical protein
MRDKTASFHRKKEIARRFVPPTFHHVRRWQPVKCGVDFNRRKLSRVEKKFIRFFDFGRIKISGPMFVNPTAGSDADSALHERT